MENKVYHSVLKHYHFTPNDASMLKELSLLVSDSSEEFLDGFYDFIFEFDHAKKFIHNEEILTRHRKGIKLWFFTLFCGVYDDAYFKKLSQISSVHVKIGLPPHYVNASFSYVRHFVTNILIENHKLSYIQSFGKLIDINLDFLTLTYREEEQIKLLDDVLFLRRTIEHNQIVPYAQPIINASTMKIEKYECLMRLIEPIENKAYSVFPFLETAKKTLLYEEMEQQMIEKSFEIYRKKSTSFSLNLTYEDIANASFKAYIYDKLSHYPNGQRVVFEIVETDFIEDFNIVIDFAKKIREYGCQIAIDDFGSGYSNMENILALKPEYIKIDGSLIKNIDTSQEAKTIVKNIINMARELHTKTIAEYIHSKKVMDIVKELGVDYLQGFYLGEPVEAF